VAAFGHIGEGDIHLNVISNDGEGVDVSVHNKVFQMLKEAVSIAGTVTSELAPYEIEIMKDLKKMFDPKGIMNPGKVFSNNSAHRRDAEDAKKNLSNEGKIQE